GFVESCPHFLLCRNSSSMAFRSFGGLMFASASRISARKTVERLMLRPMKSDGSCANLSSVAISAWVKDTPTLLSGAGGAGAVAFFCGGREGGFILTCYLTLP